MQILNNHNFFKTKLFRVLGKLTSVNIFYNIQQLNYTDRVDYIIFQLLSIVTNFSVFFNNKTYFNNINLFKF